MWMTKKKVARIVFGIWLFLWVLFLIRPYVKNDLYREYKVLFSRSLDGKRAYVTGDSLYEFILFCKEAVPLPSSYRIIGLEKQPHAERRVIYYLYPHIESATPEYIFVYDQETFMYNGYTFFKQLDERRYILKRTGQ